MHCTMVCGLQRISAIDHLLTLGQVTVRGVACIQEACTADHLLAARTGHSTWPGVYSGSHGLACHAPHITCWQLGLVKACGLACVQEACPADHLLAARTGHSMWHDVYSGRVHCRSPAAN